MSSPTERAVSTPLRGARGVRTVSSLTRYAGAAAAVAALGLLALFVAQTGVLQLTGPRKSEPPPVVEHPDRPSGTNAVITGHDRNHKPFEIKAAKGQQDIAVKTLVHLQDVVGSFERQAGGMMDVSSTAGRYDTATKKFELQGNVVFSEGSRMKAVMDKAEIDTADQSLQSSGPVKVDMQGASISANGLSVSDNGTRILLKGGVKARFVTNTSPTGEGG
jgi:lipopolysaccharide export system protein LptC